MSAKTTSKSGTTLFAGDAPEVASLDADALAALFDTHDEAWALRTDTDGAEGEPGAPIVAGRLYNDTDATDEARSKGFGFVTYEDRDDAASPFFENGGAHLYVTPGSAGDSPLWQGEESLHFRRRSLHQHER